MFKNFLFKTGIADFGECYRYVFVLISAEWSRSTRHTQIHLFAFGCAFLALVCSSFIFIFFKIKIKPEQ